MNGEQAEIEMQQAVEDIRRKRNITHDATACILAAMADYEKLKAIAERALNEGAQK